MQVKAITATPPEVEVEADTICVGLFDPPTAPEWLDSRAQSLIDSGVVKGKSGQIAVLFGEGESPHTLLVGLGKEEDFNAEKARVAAAEAFGRASETKARKLAWAVPEGVSQAEIAAALTEGCVLASYRFDRFKSKDPAEDENGDIKGLLVASASDVGEAVTTAKIVAEAANAARELQDLPANEATPTFLGEYAQELAGEIEGLTVEVLDKKALERKKMGGILAVAKGSIEEPRLIVLRYQPGNARGDLLGLVGKAVTFDSGGISLKHSSKMHEMKMDMSGGAAVIEATAAIARLGLPVRLVTVVPSVENMPSDRSVKPGDIVTTYAGKTVEIINTDAEGRMILADALAYTAELGAERIIDLATLTGSILIALGSTYAGLMSNSDELAKGIIAAAETTGELVWSLPLHEEYFDLTKGKITDLVNASEDRKAGPLYAASFLEQFVDEKPWAHLDIAGTSWDIGRSYAGKGPTGFGVRLLVELARRPA